MSRDSGSTTSVGKSVHIRIELTRREGWAILEFIRQAGHGDEFGDYKALESFVAKVRARLGVNQERYGER